MLLCPLRSPTLPRLVREGQVDGVVCLITDRLAFESLSTVALPVVHIAITIAHHELGDTPTLSVEDQKGSALATRHLVELGHRRIAYIGFSNLPSAKVPFESLRFEGYRNALHEAAIPFDETLVKSGMENPGVEAGSEAMQQLLKGVHKGKALPFTALVCHNAPMAMGAIHTLQEAGFRVPEDVSVVGFDGISTQHAFRPAITSIRFAREQMGRRAVRLLSEMEEDAAAQRKHHESFAVELVGRESTKRYSGESLYSATESL